MLCALSKRESLLLSDQIKIEDKTTKLDATESLGWSSRPFNPTWPKIFSKSGSMLYLIAVLATSDRQRNVLIEVYSISF